MSDNVIRAYLRRTLSNLIWNRKYRPSLWILICVILLAHLVWILVLYFHTPQPNGIFSINSMRCF